MSSHIGFYCLKNLLGIPDKKVNLYVGGAGLATFYPNRNSFGGNFLSPSIVK
jgi:hypothetical protein